MPTPTPSFYVYELTTAQLQAELRGALESAPVPLQNPLVRMQPPDRVAVSASVPFLVFLVPVELEARVTVENQAVKVSTTRVEAVGSQLPPDLTAALGAQIDGEGTRAVASALPAGARVRAVRVEPGRVVIEVLPT